MDLSGKHALVTGGGTGIGLAIAQALADSVRALHPPRTRTAPETLPSYRTSDPTRMLPIHLTRLLYISLLSTSL